MLAEYERDAKELYHHARDHYSQNKEHVSSYALESRTGQFNNY